MSVRHRSNGATFYPLVGEVPLGRLPREPGDVALFVYGLSVLVSLALFKAHGFLTNNALWTPVVFGVIQNVGHLAFLGEGGFSD
jgi:hypothetical protein